jgi:hypothetical protein
MLTTVLIVAGVAIVFVLGAMTGYNDRVKEEQKWLNKQIEIANKATYEMLLQVESDLFREFNLVADLTSDFKKQIKEKPKLKLIVDKKD